MASYYGTRQTADARSVRPCFNPVPRTEPRFSRERPSPAAQLSMRFTGARSHGEVLAVFDARRGCPELDCTNLATCVSACARRCKEEGPAAARQCLADGRWQDLLELVGGLLRELQPRGLAAVAWGLATLKAEQPLLVKRLAWQAHMKLDLFEARGLANLIWALATLGASEPEVSVVGAQLYPRLAERAVQLMGDFRPQELANILWAFATLGIRNEALFQAAAPAMLAILDEMNAYDLGQTAWAYASMRLRHETLFDAIAARVKAGKDSHKPINVANLCWAYAKVAYTDEAYYSHLTGVARELLPQSCPQDLSNVLWSLATVRCGDKQLCALASARACQGVRRGELTSVEIASLLWSLAKLEEPAAEHTAFIDAGVDVLCGRLAACLETGGNLQRVASMCLWALDHFGLIARFWEVAERLIGLPVSVDPGSTAFSTMLSRAQGARDLERELAVWAALRQRCAQPLLAAAVACAAALSCHRRGEDARGRAVLEEAPLACTDVAAWRHLYGQLGGHLSSLLPAVGAVAAVPPVAPKREGMTYAELYAKELDCFRLVDGGASPGNAASVVDEIVRCVAERKAWLKLAGGEKAEVMARLVEARRPRLVVEVGFYVGYSSSCMAQRLRTWGGRVVSVEVDPVHAAIGQANVVLAGLADVVDVWVGHSKDVFSRLIREFGPQSVDMAFFDQKGTIYHTDLDVMEDIGVLAPGALVVADNVLKPGAPAFLWNLHCSPSWELQIVSVREYESEAIEDWISAAVYQPASEMRPARSPAPPRSFEGLAFETDAIRWRAMTQELTLADWVRHVRRVSAALAREGIEPTARVEQGCVVGLRPVPPAVAAGRP